MNKHLWRSAIAASCFTLVLAQAPLRARADTTEAHIDKLATKFIINDADPEKQVPNAREALGSPLQMGYWVMLVSERAEAATKRGDFAAAVKYYRALIKAAPDRAIGFTRACASYEAMGDLVNATKMCRAALETGRVTIEDHAHFVRLELARKSALTPAELTDVDAVITHVSDELTRLGSAGAETKLTPEQVKSGQLLVQGLRCQLGTRLQDAPRLAKCTAALRALAPRDPKTLAFQFTYDVLTQKLDQAAQVIATAKQAGMPAGGLTLMQAKLDQELARRPLWSRMMNDGRGVAILLFGMLVLFVIAWPLAQRKSRSAVANASA